ncbi:MAG: hypothetical protein AAF611_18160 [Bacteroidota bacterium]
MAKHWKSFVKKETAPKKENEDIENIASLLSPEAKKSDKSLEDVAEFNSSLKSLIEEQKQLEDQMAELTGKKKKDTTDKKYEYEIKTIDQKKKEEAAAAAKRQKRKESHRKKHDDRWEVTPSFNKKRKESPSVSAISEKRTKAKPNTDFIQKKKVATPAVRIPKVQKRPDQPLVSTPKKKATALLQFEEKLQKVKKPLDDFTKRPKKSVAEVVQKSTKKPVARKPEATKPKTQKPKRQQKTVLQQLNKRAIEKLVQQPKKKVEPVAKTIKKGTEKLNSFVNNPKTKKQVQSIQTVAKKASKAMDTFDTVSKKVSKVNDTFQTVQQTGNDIQTGLDQVTSVVKSPELQTLSKKVSKGMGIVNKVGSKLNKVDKVFNTANKKLEKVNTVTHLFEKKLKAVDFISGNDTKTKNGFDFDFIQQQQTKKEETKGFNVAENKLHVDFNTIKNIKKDIDTLKNAKKQKDSFAF